MSTTTVWHWLLMWPPAINSTSALSGGVRIIVVRFLNVSIHPTCSCSCSNKDNTMKIKNHSNFLSLLAAFLCPDTLRYQACLPACTSQSCPNHDFDSDPDQCSGLTEGCVCPEGTLLHRPYSALCISPEKCGKKQGLQVLLTAYNYKKDNEKCLYMVYVCVCVCLQPALTAQVFLVHTARFGKLQRTPAACTAVTTTPSSLLSTTAPVWWLLCAIEQERRSSAWLTTPAAAQRESVVRLA